MTRCGTVALAGRPNVGKSTLLNALVGEHLAIVSPKPQSTRLPVVGLLTTTDAQFIFTDSPGLLEPEYPLHEAMRAAALRAIADAEVIVYLHPLPEYPAPDFQVVAGLQRPACAPVVTVYTKADLVAPSARPPVRPSDLVVSAVTRDGLDAVTAETTRSDGRTGGRSEEHTSELQSRPHLVCRLLLEKKKNKEKRNTKLNNSYGR